MRRLYRILGVALLVVASRAGADPTLQEINLYKSALAVASSDPAKACELWNQLPGGSKLGRLAEIRASLVFTPPSRIDFQESEFVLFGALVHQHLMLTLDRLEKEVPPAEFREPILRELEMIPNLNVEPRERGRLIQRAVDIANSRLELTTWLPRLLKTRETISPRFKEKFIEAEYPIIIEDFIENLEYAQLRKWLTSQLSTPGLAQESQYLLRLSEAQSFKRQQQRTNNLKSLRRLFQWVQKNSQDPNQRHEALTLYGRALWTEGKREEAKKLFVSGLPEFEAMQPDPEERASQIYWLLARIFEEEKKYTKSNEWALKGQKLAKPNSSLDEKLRFLEAWNLKKLGRDKEAIERLKTLLSMNRSIGEKSKYAFWIGWLSEKLKLREQAAKHFDIAESLDPFGYYNLLSHIHREKIFPPLVKREEAKSIQKSGPSFSDEWVSLLAALDENELLLNYLEARLGELSTEGNFEKSLYYATALASVGSHLPLIQIFNGMKDEAQRWNFFMDDPSRLFPRKFLKIVESSAKKNGIPPEFILSIIRQESTFDPKAKSSADALGLMQVLASEGPRLAGRLKMRFNGFEDLYDPEVNIPLGSLLLGDLYKRFKGNLFLTAAGYNANPAAVRRWIKARNQQSFIEFMEEIPYEETRAYMKLVLRNFVYYRRIANPDSAVPAPKECIQSLQFPKLSTGKRKK